METFWKPKKMPKMSHKIFITIFRVKIIELKIKNKLSKKMSKKMPKNCRKYLLSY